MINFADDCVHDAAMGATVNSVAQHTHAAWLLMVFRRAFSLNHLGTKHDSLRDRLEPLSLVKRCTVSHDARPTDMTSLQIQPFLRPIRVKTFSLLFKKMSAYLDLRCSVNSINNWSSWWKRWIWTFLTRPKSRLFIGLILNERMIANQCSVHLSFENVSSFIFTWHAYVSQRQCMSPTYGLFYLIESLLPLPKRKSPLDPKLMNQHPWGLEVPRSW